MPHFFHSLCQSAGITLHLAVRGDNAHHMVEGCFKATARALRMAVEPDPRVQGVPSTKGTLGGIVVDFQQTIVHIPQQLRPTAEGIMDCHGDFGLARKLRRAVFQPDL